MTDPRHATSRSTQRPPERAWYLGLLGLLPFVGGLLALLVAPEPMKAPAEQALLIYGAVILSFLGGIWWGMAAGTEDKPHHLNRYYLLSVMPSLIGWGAALIGGTSGLIILSIAFLAVLSIDQRMHHRRLFPSWWMRLRKPLTIGVVSCLAIAAIVV